MLPPALFWRVGPILDAVTFAAFDDAFELCGGHPGEPGEFLFECLGEGFIEAFVGWAGPPHAVHPEVLIWGAADHGFHGAAVASGEIEEGIGVAIPFFWSEGIDDFGDIAERAGATEAGLDAGAVGDGFAGIEAAGKAADDGGFELHGHESDGFVGAAEASKVGDEDATIAAILVGDEPGGVAHAHGFGDIADRAPFADEGESAAASGLAHPAIQGAIIQGSIDSVDWEAHEGEGVANQLPVADVAGDEGDGSGSKQGAHGGGDIGEGDVSWPAIFGEEAGSETELGTEFEDVFIGTEGQASVFIFIQIRERFAEVFDAALQAFAIDETGAERAAEGAGSADSAIWPGDERECERAQNHGLGGDIKDALDGCGGGQDQPYSIWVAGVGGRCVGGAISQPDQSAQVKAT